MKIAPPGGELTFWSVMWILFWFGCIYLGVARGESYFFYYGAFVGLPAVGMWLGIRGCGYVYGAAFVILLPVVLYLLVFVDDTLGERLARAFRIASAGYFAWITFVWARSEDD